MSMRTLNRRGFVASALAGLRAWGKETTEAWRDAELLEPAELAKVLMGTGKQTRVMCVGFPVLYRNRHIARAELAGPANKPDGIERLHNALAGLPRGGELVIYCGCCPMVNCPNLRPAYRLLKEMGFEDVRVLNLPTNFHTDWTAKGYPVQT